MYSGVIGGETVTSYVHACLRQEFFLSEQRDCVYLCNDTLDALLLEL